MRKIGEKMDQLIEYIRQTNSFNKNGWDKYAAVFEFCPNRTTVFGCVDFIYKKGNNLVYLDVPGSEKPTFIFGNDESYWPSASNAINFCTLNIKKAISEFTNNGEIGFTFLNLLRFCPESKSLWTMGVSGDNAKAVWCKVFNERGSNWSNRVILQKKHLTNMEQIPIVKEAFNGSGDFAETGDCKIQNNENARQQKSLYIMKCKNTGHYKIGISANPKARESTLQSEKPSIKMVGQWDQLAGMERELHQQYADQRIRGEWFNLTPTQVRFICHDLTTKSKQVANF